MAAGSLIVGMKREKDDVDEPPVILRRRRVETLMAENREVERSMSSSFSRFSLGGSTEIPMISSL